MYCCHGSREIYIAFPDNMVILVTLSSSTAKPRLAKSQVPGHHIDQKLHFDSWAPTSPSTAGTKRKQLPLPDSPNMQGQVADPVAELPRLQLRPSPEVLPLWRASPGRLYQLLALGSANVSCACLPVVSAFSPACLSDLFCIPVIGCGTAGCASN